MGQTAGTKLNAVERHVAEQVTGRYGAHFRDVDAHEAFPRRDNVDRAHRRTLRRLYERGLLRLSASLPPGCGGVYDATPELAQALQSPAR